MGCVAAGKLFSFELLDAQGGEIRGAGFNQCVDKFEPLMQQGSVIIMSKASLKNKRPGSVSTPLVLVQLCISIFLMLRLLYLSRVSACLISCLLGHL